MGSDIEYKNDKYLEDEADDSKRTVKLFRNREIPINDLLKHFGVFGTTGSGKTVTLARIMEIFAENEIAFTCWDVESTSFWTIPEKYPNVRFTKLEPLIDEERYNDLVSNQGSKENKPYFANKQKQLDFMNLPEAKEKLEKIEQMAEMNYVNSAKQIYSFENIPDMLMGSCIVYTYIKKLFDLSSEYFERNEALLHIIILDEAHWAMPFWTADVEKTLYTNKILEICRKIATMGRRRWLLLGCASQRLPDISVNIRSQLQNIILQKAGPKDIWHYAEFMKNLPMKARKEISASCLNLKPGHAVLVEKGWVIPACKVAMRKSKHPEESASYYKAIQRAKRARLGRL